MKIGICDDLQEDIICLKKYCNHLGFSEIYTYTSGEELLQYLEHSTLNLIFLDVEMGGLDGIEIKKILEKKMPSLFISFCTRHQEVMQDAFGRNVINFISKPYTEEAVKESIDRAVFFSKDFYPLKIDGRLIKCGDIFYLHAEDKYTIFYLANGETLSTRKPLKEWAVELDSFGFCPTSRSAIVNLKYYHKYTSRELILQNGVSIPISRSYRPLVKNRYNQYLLSLMEVGN